MSSSASGCIEGKSLDDIRQIADSTRFDYFCWDLYARVTDWYGDDKERLAVRAQTLHDIEHGGNDNAAAAAFIADRIVRCHLQTMARMNVDYILTPFTEETKLAIERALPHYARAYGLSSIALRYFNASGADPDGELGEDHDPEVRLDSEGDSRRDRRRPAGSTTGTDYPTPDGTCLRDYIHVNDLADAHVLALDVLRRDLPVTTAYNLGTGRPYSVLEVIATVERTLGQRVPHSLGPRRGGDPAVLFASSDKARTELGWTPRLPELSVIVETACRWHLAHPHGYAGGATVR